MLIQRLEFKSCILTFIFYLECASTWSFEVECLPLRSWRSERCLSMLRPSSSNTWSTSSSSSSRCYRNGYVTVKFKLLIFFGVYDNRAKRHILHYIRSYLKPWLHNFVISKLYLTISQEKKIRFAAVAALRASLVIVAQREGHGRRAQPDDSVCYYKVCGETSFYNAVKV